MVKIVNYGTLGGGFRHYSGLLPATTGSGNVRNASVRMFHIPNTNADAIFRGDIVGMTVAAAGAGIAGQNGGNLYDQIFAFGGAGLGNAGIAPDVTRLDAGESTKLIAGVVVGFGFTLAAAKNGMQYIPAGIESWVAVDTDPEIEMYITQPAASQIDNKLFALYDILDTPAQRQTRFGISGMSLGAAAVNTVGPLRLLSSGLQIGNETGANTGAVAMVGFNPARHFRTSANNIVPVPEA